MARISSEPWRHAINTALSHAEMTEVTALYNGGFTGKWMPFSAPGEVKAIWAQIVEPPEAGRLGWAAKVDISLPPGRNVLTCVYTKGRPPRARRPRRPARPVRLPPRPRSPADWRWARTPPRGPFACQPVRRRKAVR
ncbi:putative phosphothreonine lyase domain-containing protein [Spirillospora sp. CA-255316]